MEMEKWGIFVKIDICGSKGYFVQSSSNDDEIRAKLLDELLELAEEIFPRADKSYPTGSLYNPSDSASLAPLCPHCEEDTLLLSSNQTCS